jgi:riboflavin synthase
MFTGIIEAVGQINTVQINAQGARISISTGLLDMQDVKLGDSIATNGICLTVVDIGTSTFSADVSNETLKRTGFAYYKSSQKVNLEKAMLPTTRFGGHMVSGHVDALSEIVAIEHDGNSIHYWVAMPNDIAAYIAEKGSITIDGTSLTVNGLSDSKFRLTVVPHTTQETIISSYKVGSKVNVEVDLIARYIERLLTNKTAENTQQSGVTHDLLARNGFIK